MPQVSYGVILTRGAARAEVALQSIAAQQVSAEMLLVLNDADAAMRELAARWAARGARVVHDGADLGMVLAYNVALRESRAPLFCTVHEDCELAAGCVERLLATLHEHEEAAAVVPSVDTPAATGLGANVVWSDGATSQLSVSGRDAVIATDYGASNCQVLRRDVLASLGGFDLDLFPAIYADADVGVRLWQTGWAVLCDQRARNFHRVGAMVDEARGPRHSAAHRQFLLERNRKRFVAKHEEWLSGQPVRADLEDASHPEENEIEDALTLTTSRWRDLPRPRGIPGVPRVDIPDSLEDTVAMLRSEVTEEFLAHLLERNDQLANENARLHAAFAELHAEHVALHEHVADVQRAHNEMRAELDRLREAAAN
ncbi:MAG: glycosyltransferase [Actinomycetota bacterium]|nr:glycosyltransferase [Actinomycetota bacterium]